MLNLLPLPCCKENSILISLPHLKIGCEPCALPPPWHSLSLPPSQHPTTRYCKSPSLPYIPLFLYSLALLPSSLSQLSPSLSPSFTQHPIIWYSKTPALTHISLYHPPLSFPSYAPHALSTSFSPSFSPSPHALFDFLLPLYLSLSLM